jgi:hypothetical protein
VSCCVVAAADYVDARLVDSVWKMMLVYGIVEGFVGELLFGLRRQYAGKDRLVRIGRAPWPYRSKRFC